MTNILDILIGAGISLASVMITKYFDLRSIKEQSNFRINEIKMEKLLDELKNTKRCIIDFYYSSKKYEGLSPGTRDEYNNSVRDLLTILQKNWDLNKNYFTMDEIDSIDKFIKKSSKISWSIFLKLPNDQLPFPAVKNNLTKEAINPGWDEYDKLYLETIKIIDKYVNPLIEIYKI